MDETDFIQGQLKQYANQMIWVYFSPNTQIRDRSQHG